MARKPLRKFLPEISRETPFVRDFLNVADMAGLVDQVIGKGDTVRFVFMFTAEDAASGKPSSIYPTSIRITDGIETFRDDGSGVLIGNRGGTGAVNYTTGIGSVSFHTPPLFDAEVRLQARRSQEVPGIVGDFEDSLSRVMSLRDPREIDADFLPNLKDMLGVPAVANDFSESELRLLLEQVHSFYKRSGTRFFVKFLGYVKQIPISLIRLYNSNIVPTEIINAVGNNVNYIVLVPPVAKGTFRAVDSSGISQTLFDLAIADPQNPGFYLDTGDELFRQETGAASGGVAATINGTVPVTGVKIGTLKLFIGTQQVAHDNGLGGLVTDIGAQVSGGSINYQNGTFSITFTGGQASGDLVATYEYQALLYQQNGPNQIPVGTINHRTGTVSATYLFATTNPVTVDYRTDKYQDFFSTTPQLLGFGNGVTTAFAGSFGGEVCRGSVRITSEVAPGVFEMISDDQDGNLVSDNPAAPLGSINYATGAWSINFANAPDNLKPILSVRVPGKWTEEGGGVYLTNHIDLDVPPIVMLDPDLETSIARTFSKIAPTVIILRAIIQNVEAIGQVNFHAAGMEFYEEEGSTEISPPYFVYDIGYGGSGYGEGYGA